MIVKYKSKMLEKEEYDAEEFNYLRGIDIN
jgi:hypothetical protein